MARRDFERGIRDLHGADAEIIEYEPADGDFRPSGRRYVVRRARSAVEDWPAWVRLGLFIPALIVLLIAMAACLWGLWFCVLFLWQLFAPTR